MSIQPEPNPAPNPAVVYFVASRAPLARLRNLTALDQMYAYWGSDRAA
jgi:hypothetical protein